MKIVLQAEAIAYGKVDRFHKWPIGSVIKSILAGMYIAFGGLLMGLLKANGYNSLVSSAGFSLGLFLVVLANGELFTGNCLVNPFIEDTLANSYSSVMLIANYIFNFVGIGIILVLVYNISSIDKTFFEDIAIAKANIIFNVPTVIELLIKGFLCNILVCLAIWIANYSNYCNDGLNKAIAVILPVTAFVFCGFEHCIANMFFLPFGIFAGKITLFQAVMQLLIVTIGNWFGGRLIGILLRETIIGEKIDFLRDNDIERCNHCDNCSDDSDSKDSI